MKYSHHERVIVGYLVPINQSKNFKLVFKEDTTQIFHYEFFKNSVMKLLQDLNPNTDYLFTTKDYECIPRFRYLEKDKTLYIPDNFEFSDMVLSHIIRDLDLNEMISILEIEQTSGEQLRELEIFKILKKVIIVD